MMRLQCVPRHVLGDFVLTSLLRLYKFYIFFTFYHIFPQFNKALIHL